MRAGSHGLSWTISSRSSTRSVSNGTTSVTSKSRASSTAKWCARIPGPGHRVADVVVRDDERALLHCGHPREHPVEMGLGRSVPRRRRRISGSSRATREERRRDQPRVRGQPQELAAEHTRRRARREALEREAHQVVVRGREPRSEVCRRVCCGTDAVAQPGVAGRRRCRAPQPGAPAEVEVLPLEEEGLVEAAELEQERRGG